MRSWTGRWIILAIMLVVDWYVFQAVRTVMQGSSDRTRFIIGLVYWLLSLASILVVLFFPYMQNPQWKVARGYLFALVVGLFFAKLLAAIFFLVDDVRRLGIWLLSKLFPQTGARFLDHEGMISRSTFLSWLGLGVGGTLFGTFVYGFSNKYNYQVKRLTLRFPNLPEAFRGFKLVQISDVHAGSFQNKEAVNRGIDRILAENADLIVFTGDLVNDRADEMDPYIDVFSRLKAPMGVYSILGNHDYGDYYNWPSMQAKVSNLQRLKQLHGQMGWRLLMNEHVPLEKNGARIALLGVENWSARSSFPKHGRLAEAHAGSEAYPFRILLSHDPSHWDAEVKTRFGDIDLMLAGHTHGMQFGVELPFFRWSPVQYVYKQWAGLYEAGRQKLYVNRGFGFIGYPGRVGILPEITVITLEKG